MAQRAKKLDKLRGKWSLKTMQMKIRKAKFNPRQETLDILEAYFVNGQQQKDIVKPGRSKQAVSNCLHRFIMRLD